MAKAEVPLLIATETAVKANPGSQAVSIYPQLQSGQAVAEVTLLQGTVFEEGHREARLRTVGWDCTSDH